jgi:hypothetical protein
MPFGGLPFLGIHSNFGFQLLSLRQAAGSGAVLESPVQISMLRGLANVAGMR